jgi:hypothetical protein
VAPPGVVTAMVCSTALNTPDLARFASCVFQVLVVVHLPGSVDVTVC